MTDINEKDILKSEIDNWRLLKINNSVLFRNYSGETNAQSIMIIAILIFFYLLGDDMLCVRKN